mgnify:CR=1 FL=1
MVCEPHKYILQQLAAINTPSANYGTARYMTEGIYSLKPLYIANTRTETNRNYVAQTNADYADWKQTGFEHQENEIPSQQDYASKNYYFNSEPLFPSINEPAFPKQKERPQDLNKPIATPNTLFDNVKSPETTKANYLLDFDIYYSIPEEKPVVANQKTSNLATLIEDELQKTPVQSTVDKDNLVTSIEEELKQAYSGQNVH